MYFPDITTTLSTSTAGATALVTWALPAVVALISIVLGGLVARKVFSAITSAGNKVLNGRRSGGRRRRR